MDNPAFALRGSNDHLAGISGMVRLVVESLEQQGDEVALQLLHMLALLPTSGVPTCLLDGMVDGRDVGGRVEEVALSNPLELERVVDVLGWSGLVRKVEREGEGGMGFGF